MNIFKNDIETLPKKPDTPVKPETPATPETKPDLPSPLIRPKKDPSIDPAKA